MASPLVFPLSEQTKNGARVNLVSARHLHQEFGTNNNSNVLKPNGAPSAVQDGDGSAGVVELGKPVDTHFGTLPPSPPESIDRMLDDDDEDEIPPSILTPPTVDGVIFTFDEPSSITSNDRLSTTTTTNTTQSPLLYRYSSDVVRSSGNQYPAPPSIEFTPSTPSLKGKEKDLTVQTTPTRRPTRRNTTGSNHTKQLLNVPPTTNKSSPLPHTPDDFALVSDIEIHAERIRRERMSKRVKLQQAEAALTRELTRGSGSGAKDDVSAGARDRDMPMVGNLIGEGHVNYVLMYNMLTGIRIGVSRCQAKVKRPLTDDDFTARHKFSFDIVGNELTPSAKYDFKFKDYAPWVFRSLREEHFHLDPADYLLSLTAKYILTELGSPGKSGSFFYFSRDYKYIIKTIRHSEHLFLLKILKQYYAHVKENPHNLLSRFYGLHRVKLPRGKKIHFVIMNNLFPPHRDVHETYDLKGSTVGRLYPESKAQGNPRAVLKDLNWINRHKQLELGPEKRALLTEQLRRDAEFLKSVQVMDYSLLVGIHFMERGNRDNVRRKTLKVFSPDLPPSSALSSSSTALAPSSSKHKSKSGANSASAIAMRRAMRSSDPKALDHSTLTLPEQLDPNHQTLSSLFLFNQDEGGLQATDENNEGMEVVYYLGVIDILTPWGWVKRAEGLWKGLGADRHKISPVPPSEYAGRFFSFMKAVMRGGEGGERFKPKQE